jgi:hypothetical protein
MEHFSWTLEAEEALTKLKATLSNSPILVPPTTGEPPPTLHRRNDTSGQCGLGHREGRGRTYPAHLETGLLHQRGALGNQGSLPVNLEIAVCHRLNVAQTLSLL